MIRFLSLFLLCFFLAPLYPVMAAETPTVDPTGDGLGDVGAPGGDGQCDWTDYKNSICKTESGCKYTIANSIGATGKYQFMPKTAAGMKSYQQAPSGCKSMGRSNSGLARDACAGTQEAMMDEFSMKNLKYLKKSCPAAAAAVNSGRTVTGSKGKTCKVTWSGILAGAHLGGAGGVCSVLKNGGDRNDGHTSIKDYICTHGGKQVPGTDCNPQQYQTEGGPQPTGEPHEAWTNFTPAAGIGTGNFNSLSDALKQIWVAAFQLMTSQLTTTMIQQVEVIGTFFDAKHQLETQRIMQKRYARAHKDYHPSVQMCEIGTMARDLANTEIRTELTKTALSNGMLGRALGSGDVKTMRGAESDYDTRVKSYIDLFCSKKDNAQQNDLICQKEGDPAQQNADINYTQTIDAPLTLDINFLGDGEKESEKGKKEKANLFAFLDYIFMHESFPFVPKSKTEYSPFVTPYQNMRSLVAMRSVAQNSFANIIAQKTAGPSTEDGRNAAPFIKALMKELGIEKDEIEATIGKNPSYYAQMEVLTKKIYQHPEFISNLYDKPANVKRLRAAMTAIKLMQDRDIHDSMMRREMLISMILELQLREKQQGIMDATELMLSRPPPPEVDPTDDGLGDPF